MVFTNKYTKVLMERIPDFAISETLKNECEFEADAGQLSIAGVFNCLTSYVQYELMMNNELITKEEINIYNVIEEMITTYSGFPVNSEESDFDTAACTCFLENLINIADAGRVKYERFIPYLGKNSKNFCRAWDEFTGVKSPGLWD
jgi:hypothetical protein